MFAKVIGKYIMSHFWTTASLELGERKGMAIQLSSRPHSGGSGSAAIGLTLYSV